MAYTIVANNKVYTVDPHAAQRMLQRGISEAWVIETLEQAMLLLNQMGVIVTNCRNGMMSGKKQLSFR